MKQKIRVEFYFTPSSRYSYLASTQLEKIAQRIGCTFDWKPLNNHAILERFGADPFKSASLSSGQYAWSYREQDAKRWAAYYGVPFEEPVNFRKDPLWLERGCFAAEACGQLVPFCHALFKAIFVEGRVLEEDDLQGLASNVGIPVPQFNESFSSEDTKDRQESILKEAVKKEIFGVPSFFVDGTLFWGNDRLILLEHKLREMHERNPNI